MSESRAKLSGNGGCCCCCCCCCCCVTHSDIVFRHFLCGKSVHRQNFGEHFQLAILDSRTPALNGEPNYIYIYTYIYICRLNEDLIVRVY